MSTVLTSLPAAAPPVAEQVAGGMAKLGAAGVR